MNSEQDLREIFKKLDFDNDGVIDISELIMVLHKLNWKSEYVVEIMNKVDLSQNGFISFEEFGRVFSAAEPVKLSGGESLVKFFNYSQSLSSKIDTEAIIKLFHEIDTNRNGSVEVGELFIAMQKSKTPRKEIVELLLLSLKNNGQVSLNDFMQIFAKYN
jgi:Ca2+-binding EF-hand superfamily protein